MPPKSKVEVEENIRWGRPGNTLRMGLVGLPNVGKSTTFNCMTNCNVAAENYPFCTIDPTEAVVPVPDERFDHLCETWQPKSRIEAVVRIWDIAGLVPNAHEGEGLGNAFLSHISACDGIYHVCRVFSGEEDNITHTEGSIDPARDLRIIQHELIMKDKAQIDKLVESFEQKVRQNNKLKEISDELASLVKAQETIVAGRTIAAGHPDKDTDPSKKWSAKDVDFLRKYNFLTTKPKVYILNCSMKDFIKRKSKNFIEHCKKLKAWIDENGGGVMVPYSAEFEAQLQECEDEAAKKDFCESMQKKFEGSKPVSSQLKEIIQQGYSALNLQHFFTVGKDEVRSWTVQKGWRAPQAAGVIHGDFERGFICAKTYNYADFKELGDEAKVKEAGKHRQEGQKYVMRDGDIVHFEFNVTAQKGEKKK